MNILIQKAMHGNEDALHELYNQNKARILHLCSLLLASEAASEPVAAKAFRLAFEQAVQGDYSTQEEFCDGVTQKAVNLCKAQIGKENPGAFRLPIGKNFSVLAYDPEKMDFSGELQRIILKNLPPLHRFLYVLHRLGVCSPKELGRQFHLSETNVKGALDSIAGNVNRIVSLAAAKTKMELSMDEEKLHQWLLSSAQALRVPGSVNAAVFLSIDSICLPIKEKERQKKLKLISIAFAGLLAVVILIGITLALSNQSTSRDTEETEEIESEELSSEASVSYTSDYTATHYADIAVEDYGTITVALDGNKAPVTVENFVSLAKKGFYDGLTFHRIVEGFVMQGGDPEADGTGGNTDEEGNEINITGEFYYNGSDNNLSHTRGAISMARGEDYDSASSQFFIVHEETYIDSLDGLYAVFGYVTEGMDIVDALCTAVYTVDDETIAADEQPVITSITVREADSGDDSAEASSTAQASSTAAVSSTAE